MEQNEFNFRKTAEKQPVLNKVFLFTDQHLSRQQTGKSPLIRKEKMPEEIVVRKFLSN